MIYKFDDIPNVQDKIILERCCFTVLEI
ncbi:hypothetical protein CFY87_04685 [Actinobacillus seminis]|uniref:Uncharacterized protein n=1 Tax=Actinobacillus seminis TaxID=722 RepID=A0ABX4FNJ2_9PAST|nr:hypothetical protein CFY87_04685 [Actinobacillus seminis]